MFSNRAYDERCTAKGKANDYLDSMAEVLFNEKCSQRLEPNSNLKTIATITMGQSPSGSSYNENENGRVFYQGRADFDTRFPRRRLFTTEPKRMAQENDVLISVRAPVGDLNIANEECCIGRGLATVHSKYQSFIYYLLRAQTVKLNSYNGDGTVFGSINKQALNNLAIYLPSENTIREINDLLTPIDLLIRKNDDQVRQLEQARDTLLPKLMSGEMDISKVDITQLNNHLAYMPMLLNFSPRLCYSQYPTLPISLTFTLNANLHSQARPSQNLPSC